MSGANMTYVDMGPLSNMQRYWLITGSIAPRPIALVTSCTAEDHCNAAPFSSFTYMGEEPALMVLGIDKYGEESHRPTELKDTLQNIIARKEFVVNMVDEAIGEKMAACATDYPAHVSEPQEVGFNLAQSVSIGVPRLAEAPIAWECKLFKVFEFSPMRSIVFGEIAGMHFREDLLDAKAMRVRVERFAPLGRLGGPNYCRSTDRIRLPIATFTNSGKPRV
jgi:flavin reductase (DIM6/NTAB) family NADH-FMN oxidoreductase RutF